MEEERRKVDKEWSRSRSVLLVSLRAVRQTKALTQEELSRRSGVSKGTIRRLENLEREGFLRTARKIAAGLDVQPVELMREHPRE